MKLITNGDYKEKCGLMEIQRRRNTQRWRERERQLLQHPPFESLCIPPPLFSPPPSSSSFPPSAENVVVGCFNGGRPYEDHDPSTYAPPSIKQSRRQVCVCVCLSLFFCTCVSVSLVLSLASSLLSLLGATSLPLYLLPRRHRPPRRITEQ